MRVEFQGHSDDLVHITGDAKMLNGQDKGQTNSEWGAMADKTPFHIVGAVERCSECGRLKEPEHLATVYALYDGAWSFAVSMANEEDGKYKWPVGWTASVSQDDHMYSLTLTLDTGSDVVSIRGPVD